MNTFETWHRNATVRSKRRTQVEAEQLGSKVCWPLFRTPGAMHPRVVCRGPGVQRDLATEHFYSFHQFTEHLEHEAVNPIVTKIAYGRFDSIRIPTPMKKGAFGIYADEAYHALNSADLIDQIEHMTQRRATDYIEPAFFKSLRRVKIKTSGKLHELIDLLFVTVSETLITSTFSEIPRDDSVLSAVRENLRFHAVDEGRHAAYFSQLFSEMWPQLNVIDRQCLGKLIPELIFGFCRLDFARVRANLIQCDFTIPESSEIIDDLKQDTSVEKVKGAAQACIQLFKRVGVFDDSSCEDSFHAAGLL